jgi:fructan beta-fructosidase
MRYFILATLLYFTACAPTELDPIQTSGVDTSEVYRPLYHFSPEAHWMNDPNGMFYKDGTYHLYFQYYPEGNQWGPMHWGHAHWTEHPIAIYPDTALGYIFSGSAVIDTFNVSGLAVDSIPPIIAMYTFHKRPRDVQTQGISYSLDGGMTYEFYQGNPVLPNPELKDFRDPKMMWDGTQWICALTVGQEIAFYGSENLLDWTPLSRFSGEYGNHGGVWECPELFSLTTEEGIRKDILLVSIGSGAPNGGSGTQYFVGHWDGKEFIAEHEDQRYMDWGRDNYAGVNWWNAPTNRGKKLFMGWMSNWEYAQVVPTYKWRSSMTLPRELSLVELDGQFHIKQQFRLDGGNGFQANLEPTMGLRGANTFGINFSAEPQWSLRMTSAAGDTLDIWTSVDSIYINRSKCGIVDFETSFKNVMRGPRKANGDAYEMYMDVMSLELLADDGLTAMTATFFPKAPFNLLEFKGLKEGTLTSLRE